jgi:diguanylate cyclase (GGDEF)-like protein
MSGREATGSNLATIVSPGDDLTTGRQPRLLAIDDSHLIHRLLKAHLKRENVEIHGTMSGRKGLEMVKALHPDVILLDIDMPEIDGFAVLTQIMDDPGSRDVPVIFVSAMVDTEVKVRGLDMGAIDFVTKPFDVAELKARVRSALRLRRAMCMLEQRAQIDALTGLWNRRFLDERLDEEIAKARRGGTRLSLLLCDIDHFKTLNDEHGHPFGDHVLEVFAGRLAAGRKGDVACRYGGEEFALILPAAGVREAEIVADRIRRWLAEVEWSGRESLQVTASFGATDLPRAGDPTVEGLIASADEALYRAKRSGRNRVCAAECE